LNILVTGAGGWMGGELVRFLGAAGNAVIAAARSAESLSKRLPGGETVRRAIFDATGEWPDVGPCDVVVHLAGEAEAHGRPTTDYIEKNAGAAIRLVDFCRRVRPQVVVFASSISVFGRIGSPRVDEATPIVDPAPYGMSKRLAELVLADHAAWLNSLSIRLPGVLGPGASTPWLASVARKARANEHIAIYNPDAPFNNAVHVSDLAKFIVRLATKPPAGADVVVLGAGGEAPVRAVVECLKQACGSSSLVTEIWSERTSFVIDSRRAINLYSYAPMNIRDMLRRFASEP